MAYQRVTGEERRLVYRWRRAGCGVREIARRLGRAASRRRRELLRNRGQQGYRPKQAHWKATEQAKRSGPRRFTAAVRLEAEARRKEGRTPEIIGQRARGDGTGLGVQGDDRQAQLR